MDLFRPQYPLRYTYENSSVLTKHRINQWRLRKVLPAEKEGSGPGYPASFSLWNLVHADLLDLFANSSIALATAAEILGYVKTIIKRNQKVIDNWDHLVVTVDLGAKSHPILAMRSGDKAYIKESLGRGTGFALDIPVGKYINLRVRQLS